MKKTLFYLLITSSMFACKSETKNTFDLNNAKKEIESTNKVLTELFAKGDSVGMAASYSKDGALMTSNMPSVKGKENLTKVWGEFIKAGFAAINLTTLEVWGDDNYITEEGVFEIKTKDGGSVEKGKYLVLWKKEDGQWKLHRDMSNSDLPLTKGK